MSWEQVAAIATVLTVLVGAVSVVISNREQTRFLKRAIRTLTRTVKDHDERLDRYGERLAVLEVTRRQETYVRPVSMRDKGGSHGPGFQDPEEW